MRKLAAFCEYGELTDDLITDRLVIGVKNNGDKVRLLRETSLDLKKAIPMMCTTSEVAAQQMKKIQTAKDKAEEVKKLDDRKKAPRRRRFTRKHQQKSDDKQTKSGVEARSGFTCK